MESAPAGSTPHNFCHCCLLEFRWVAIDCLPSVLACLAFRNPPRAEGGHQLTISSESRQIRMKGLFLQSLICRWVQMDDYFLRWIASGCPPCGQSLAKTKSFIIKTDILSNECSPFSLLSFHVRLSLLTLDLVTGAHASLDFDDPCVFG